MEKSKKSGVFFIFLSILLALGAAAISYVSISRITRKVPMMIAGKNIEAGDPLQRKMFKVIKVPIDGRPSDAVIPVKNLDLSGYIALKNMSEKDILRKANITNLREKDLPILSTRLRSLDKEAMNNIQYKSEKLLNLRAAEIPISSVIGMIPQMKIGDKIAVTSVYIDEIYRENEPMEVRKTEAIFDFIDVIGIKMPNDKSKGALIIALTQKQFEALALAREKGKFYIALMAYGIKKPKDHLEILSEEYIKMLEGYEDIKVSKCEDIEESIN